MIEFCMKKFGILSVGALFVATVTGATPSFAEWTAVTKGSSNGNTFYIDFETVKEKNGRVYYWELIDALKPTSSGVLSSKSLSEVDCGTPRKFRTVSSLCYTKPMAAGGIKNHKNNQQNEWNYAAKNSVAQVMMNAACEYAESGQINP